MAEKTLVVNIKKMKFRDFKLLLRLTGAEKGAQMSSRDLEGVIDVMDRVIVGGIDDLDMTEMPAIMDAIGQAMAEANSPKN